MDQRRRKQKRKKSKRKFKMCGVTVQLSLFVFNGYLYIMSLLGIFGGLTEGLNTKTISLTFNIDIYDYIVCTPATIFFLYGLLLVIVSSLGLFSAAGSSIITCIFYMISILIFILIDVFCGFNLFYSLNSLNHFVHLLHESLKDYGAENAKGVGFISVNPKIFWNHLQIKGKCCGVESFKDWLNTTYFQSHNDSFPPSCCNSKKEKFFCRLDNLSNFSEYENTKTENLIMERGCLSIFPHGLIKSFSKLGYMFVFNGAVLIASLICALILIYLIATKKFKPSKGPDSFATDVQKIRRKVGTTADLASNDIKSFKTRAQIRNNGPNHGPKAARAKKGILKKNRSFFMTR